VGIICVGKICVYGGIAVLFAMQGGVWNAGSFYEDVERFD